MVLPISEVDEAVQFIRRESQMFERFLAVVRLKRGEGDLSVRVMSNDKMHDSIAQIAHAVEEQYAWMTREFFHRIKGTGFSWKTLLNPPRVLRALPRERVIFAAKFWNYDGDLVWRRWIRTHWKEARHHGGRQ